MEKEYRFFYKYRGESEKSDEYKTINKIIVIALLIFPDIFIFKGVKPEYIVLSGLMIADGFLDFNNKNIDFISELLMSVLYFLICLKFCYFVSAVAVPVTKIIFSLVKFSRNSERFQVYDNKKITIWNAILLVILSYFLFLLFIFAGLNFGEKFFIFDSIFILLYFVSHLLECEKYMEYYFVRIASDIAMLIFWTISQIEFGGINIIPIIVASIVRTIFSSSEIILYLKRKIVKQNNGLRFIYFGKKRILNK